MVGNWNVKVSTGMPQKVATAMSQLATTLLGAEYTPIAYLGSQVVNGTNHAVIAEQTITTGRDTTNIVLIIFNERDNAVVPVSIERVLESGLPLGGVKIEVATTLSIEQDSIWSNAFDQFTGAQVTPFAYLGTQTEKGTAYIYLATSTPVTAEPSPTKVVMVTINPMEHMVSMMDLLTARQNMHSLGYAFTW